MLHGLTHHCDSICTIGYSHCTVGYRSDDSGHPAPVRLNSSCQRSADPAKASRISLTSVGLCNQAERPRNAPCGPRRRSARSASAVQGTPPREPAGRGGRAPRAVARSAACVTDWTQPDTTLRRPFPGRGCHGVSANWLAPPGAASRAGCRHDRSASVSHPRTIGGRLAQSVRLGHQSYDRKVSR